MADAVARTGKAVTELTRPTALAPALLLTVAVYAEIHGNRGALWWGLLAAVFDGALPLAFLKFGVRRGRWDDHHVRERESRVLPLVFAICSATVGLLALIIGHAPRPLIALLVAMLAGLVAVLVLSAWWKVSIHCAVAGGATVILTAVFGLPGLVIGMVILLPAMWARLNSGDHTTTQVCVGAIIGGAAALLYLPTR